MSPKFCKISLKNNPHQYDVKIGQELLSTSGDWAKSCVAGETKKIALISNEKVFGLYGDTVNNSLQEAGFDVFIFLMEDGENFKNFESFQQVLEFLSKSGLRRTDAVLALGGGVVGDLAGFAASVYLRGLSYLQIPTTLLSMIDSSVGGKTAINTSFGKNIVGTFYQPEGVLIDVTTLKTLEKREVSAGFCEAIKHGAIGGRDVLDDVNDFLSKFPLETFSQKFSESSFLVELEDLVYQQVSFKASVVANDEKEGVDRVDAKSRKTLNFGHTVGHALEKVTDYKYFKHGEAVGYGMLAAAELSKKLDILDNNSLKLLKNVVSRAGTLPEIHNVEVSDVMEAFSNDKKSLGNELQWILLADIGSPKIISNLEIPEKIIADALHETLYK